MLLRMEKAEARRQKLQERIEAGFGGPAGAGDNARPIAISADGRVIGMDDGSRDLVSAFCELSGLCGALLCWRFLISARVE